MTSIYTGSSTFQYAPGTTGVTGPNAPTNTPIFNGITYNTSVTSATQYIVGTIPAQIIDTSSCICNYAWSNLLINTVYFGPVRDGSYSISVSCPSTGSTVAMMGAAQFIQTNTSTVSSGYNASFQVQYGTQQSSTQSWVITSSYQPVSSQFPVAGVYINIISPNRSPNFNFLKIIKYA